MTVLFVLQNLFLIAISDLLSIDLSRQVILGLIFRIKVSVLCCVSRMDQGFVAVGCFFKFTYIDRKN